MQLKLHTFTISVFFYKMEMCVEPSAPKQTRAGSFPAGFGLGINIHWKKNEVETKPLVIFGQSVYIILRVQELPSLFFFLHLFYCTFNTLTFVNRSNAMFAVDFMQNYLFDLE